MKNRKAAILVSVVLMAAGQVLAQEEAPPAAGAPGGDYAINPGDVLAISVWKEEDLQRQAIVRPDGHFSFPLAGDIRAEGTTVSQVESEITSRLSRFIPDPVVNVAVLEAQGSKVYVIGQVNRPGEFPVNRYVDVVQALAMAGGTTPFAQLNDIKILRREGGTQQAIPFSYGDVAAGRRLQQNIVLEPGDTVLVP